MQIPLAVALDANICLTHAMNLGVHFNVPVYDHNSRPVQRFVKGCRGCGAKIGTFKNTKKESYDNIAERVDDAARDCLAGRWRWYAMSSLYTIAEENLDQLFLLLTIFPDNWTHKEIADAVTFFRMHGKDMATRTNPNKPKIPEANDLEFLVSSHNLGTGKTHIASNDSHFTKNIQAIQNAYNVIVVPQDQFDAVANSLGWP